MSVISGDNILGLNLKSDTIRGYLRAAAKLYTDKKRPNPFSNKSLEKNYPEVILKALKKYESHADRREVITDSMFQHIDELASKSGPDSLLATLNDFLKWSRYSGPRQSEWCQTRKRSYDRVDENPNGEALALILDDLRFYDHLGRRQSSATVRYEDIAHVEVCWRYQKNDDNGEIIKYYRASLDLKRWCPCYALFNIARRAHRLNIPSHEPIAQYTIDNGKRYYIRDTDVSRCLQDAAKVKLGITDDATLSRWTCHSLRVTAANELHRLGFGGVFIQQRLRWRSEAFLKYLRNTIHVARQHTEAMGLSATNLTNERLLEPSNLNKVNERRARLKLDQIVFREPSDDDILWEKNFMATAQ